MSTRTYVATLSASLSLLAASASGQCQLAWPPGAPEPGPSGTVFDLMPRSNGALLALGDFDRADASLARSVATWNGIEWRELGGGILGTVLCSVELQNGDVVVGGSFQFQTGGATLHSVARWDGFSWNQMGSGLFGTVLSLAQLPNGDVIAGGDWQSSLPPGNVGVQRWNGATWSLLGTLPPGSVRSVDPLPNGDLLASGTFNGGTSSPAVRWNGTSWTFVTALGSSGSIAEVARLPSGSVIVAGDLTLASGPSTVASFDGTTATDLGAPFAAEFVAGLANGGVAAATASGPTPSIATFDGTTWTQLPLPAGEIETVDGDAAGELVVGLSLEEFAPIAHTVYRFDGTAWQPVGAPVPPTVHALATRNNGDVILGGSFRSFEGVPANNVVRYDGTGYTPLGAGVEGTVRAIGIAPDDSVIVAGSLTTAGGAPVQDIARWDGQVWTTLGSGLPLGNGSMPTDIEVAANGTVFATRSRGLFTFDGVSWTQLTVPGISIFNSVTVMPSGVLALGGFFTNFGLTSGGLIQLDPATGVASAFPGVGTQIPLANSYDTLLTANGDLLVTGTGTGRFDGTSWTSFGNLGSRMVELPDGDILFANAPPPSTLRRLSGNTVTTLPDLVGSVRAMTVAGTGEILFAGEIDSALGRVSAGLAVAEPSCPADAGIVGAGCSGGAGPVTLLADNLPWLGGTYRSTARGLTASSIALQAFGAPAPAVQLPGGAAGCSLFVNPFFALAATPAGGEVALSLDLPNDPALVGATVRQQVVAVELGAAGIVRLTSSNAIRLTIGDL